MTYNQIDLDNLEKGDQRYKVDCRSVYQELLQKTLNVDSKTVLSKEFKNLGLFG